jgi:hypothetical protein
MSVMPESINNKTQGFSRIRNCSWGYKCEKTWDSLIATDQSNIRFCDACSEEVYLCNTKRELTDSVLLNRCVAFPSRLLKASKAPSGYDPNFENGNITIGEVAADYFVKE